MKKREKCFLMTASTAMLAIAMTFSAFADHQTVNVFTNTAKHIKSINNGMYLNLEGSGAAYKNRNVTVYSYTNDDDQKWYIYDLGNGTKVYTAKNSADSNRYTLNLNRSNYNCNLYMDTDKNNEDSLVNTLGNSDSFEIELYSGPYAGYGLAIVPGSRDVRWGSVDSYAWKLLT